MIWPAEIQDDTPHCSASSWFRRRLGLLAPKLAMSRYIRPARPSIQSIMLTKKNSHPTDFLLRRHTSYTLTQTYTFISSTEKKPHPPPHPTASMCRQFYRYCRDCHEPFRMTEPDMRESCKAFEDAQAIKPFLTRCPGFEVQVIRYDVLICFG